ncbi:hypothetical protein D3C72_1224000 [compost metagenome]
MIQLTMQNLVNCFTVAIDNNVNFLAIAVKINGTPENEIIINPKANLLSKLDYYKNTYDENLNHKFSPGISIVGFTYADYFDQIEEDLTQGWKRFRN